MRCVVVTGSFDDLRSHHVRFLQEAQKLGELHVLLWSDETVRALGKESKFPQAERFYYTEAIRYVSQVTLIQDTVDPDTLPPVDGLQKTHDPWIGWPCSTPERFDISANGKSST